VRRRRGRRSKHLLDDLKERRGYCKLKEEALDRTVWRAGFGRGYGPGVRQTTLCSERLLPPREWHSSMALVVMSAVLETWGSVT
jgi:hypothetical protein